MSFFRNIFKSKKKVSVPTSSYVIRNESDIQRFVMLMNEDFRKYDDENLVSIYIARSSIDLHEQMVSNAISENSKKGVFIEFDNTLNDNIQRQENNIFRFQSDIYLCSKAKWLRFSYALKQYELLVSDNIVEGNELIEFYCKLAGFISKSGIESFESKSSIFSKGETLLASLVYANKPNDTEIFVSIVNELVPLNTYTNPIFERISSKYNLIEVSKFDKDLLDIYGLLMTKESADEWNKNA